MVGERAQTTSLAARQAYEVLREEGVGSLVAATRNFLSQKYAQRRYEPSASESHVMDEDWDSLVILDACRYDQFQRLNTVPGRLEARTSLGSCTPEFLTANFEGSTHHDTVYVTANPMYIRAEVGDAFHDVIDVWKSDWDEQNQTVRPEEMVAATLAAAERYPNKRIVSHFVQPHYPFIGETGSDLAASSDEGLSGIEWITRREEGETTKEDRATPWDLLEAGVLDEERVREAYDENLQITFPHVERLVEDLTGKTVVTSDHGNLVGERIAPFGRRRYGHPPATPTEELRKVPWLVVDGERREIHADDPGRRARETSTVVSERLADLGYT